MHYGLHKHPSLDTYRSADGQLPSAYGRHWTRWWMCGWRIMIRITLRNQHMCAPSVWGRGCPCIDRQDQLILTGAPACTNTKSSRRKYLLQLTWMLNVWNKTMFCFSRDWKTNWIDLYLYCYWWPFKNDSEPNTKEYAWLDVKININEH